MDSNGDPRPPSAQEQLEEVYRHLEEADAEVAGVLVQRGPVTFMLPPEIGLMFLEMAVDLDSAQGLLEMAHEALLESATAYRRHLVRDRIYEYLEEDADET